MKYTFNQLRNYKNNSQLKYVFLYNFGFFYNFDCQSYDDYIVWWCHRAADFHPSEFRAALGVKNPGRKSHSHIGIHFEITSFLHP